MIGSVDQNFIRLSLIYPKSLAVARKSRNDVPRPWERFGKIVILSDRPERQRSTHHLPTPVTAQLAADKITTQKWH